MPETIFTELEKIYDDAVNAAKQLPEYILILIIVFVAVFILLPKL